MSDHSLFGIIARVIFARSDTSAKACRCTGYIVKVWYTTFWSGHRRVHRITMGIEKDSAQQCLLGRWIGQTCGTASSDATDGIDALDMLPGV